ALAWLARILSRRAPSGRFTYGLRGSSILAALGNSAFLLLATGAIALEAIQRFLSPSAPSGMAVMVVAAAGVVVNGLAAWLFASGRGGDLNLRAAFAHMATDALVALGVVVAGGLILLTGQAWIDPAASLLVCAAIVVSTWRLMREALGLALHAVPAGVDPSAVLAYLSDLPGVAEVHDLHIWGMSTTETAMTAHLVRPGAALDDALIHRACGELRARFSIDHATFQIEAGSATHPCVLAPEEVV
ncbi:MAG: cation diffusion facilitator family transporter, partial [Candidatus Dormibacteria bacterium]